MGPVNEKLHEKEMRQELRLTKERHVEKFNKLLLKKKLTVMRTEMIAVIEMKMVILIQKTQQQPSTSGIKAQPMKVVTAELVSALDITKVSNQNAPCVVAAPISSLGHDPKNYSVNKESIQQAKL